MIFGPSGEKIISDNKDENLYFYKVHILDWSTFIKFRYLISQG